MTKVLCEVKECIYNMEDPMEGPAYRYQCGNDEIEIGYDGDLARCYCFEKKEE